MDPNYTECYTNRIETISQNKKETLLKEPLLEAISFINLAFLNVKFLRIIVTYLNLHVR